ncbi:ATP-binding protein [Azospirillum sp. SYSU D00513]|uniref:sensor histidine kinase n=1 Tax=Azospirillum sp. SYSU D00513 TaxID=2812561 RepID=UPI001A978915|nr:ATP-binding protein [Azospirillum sp. SYSU D00513]
MTWRPVSRLGLSVGVMGALLIAAVWVVVTALISQHHEQAVVQTRRDATNLALAFEQHVIVSLTAVEQAMKLMELALREETETRDLSRWAERFNFLGNVHLRISVIGPDGHLKGSSLPHEGGRVDLTDRQHFRIHVEQPGFGTFISRPLLGRVSGEWSIQVTRRLERADGAFAGVLVFSIDPNYFARFYKTVDLGRQGVVTLIGRDGVIRARSSGEDPAGLQGLGKLINLGALFHRLAEQPSGSFITNATVDGVERIVGYRAVTGYPLFVMVGYGLDEVLADPGQDADRVIAIAIGVTLVLAVVLLLLVSEIERRGQRERELAAERAKLRSANAELDLRHSRLEQTNADLLISKERAEAATRSRAAFLAMVSHELRTPLNAVIGFSDLMRQEATAGHLAPWADYAASINESGQHLLEVINNILDLSKLEAGQTELLREPADLVPLTRTVVRMLAHKAQDSGLSLTVETPDEAVLCDADPRAMKQVLLNLLSNAIKFTVRGGAIRVTVRFQGLGAAVTIADTGIGIAPEAMEHIFEPFTQADSRASRRFGGTGLGLTIAKRLVDLHGGRLTVESEQGVGTVARVWLPTGSGALPQRPEARRPESQQSAAVTA